MRIIISRGSNIDYEKIREIAREVAKEEITGYAERQGASLTKDDIKEAVCNGIIQADKKREEVLEEKIKNTKVSKWTIARMVFHGLIALFFVILAVATVVINHDNFLESVVNASKFMGIASIYMFIAFVNYAVDKNKDKNFLFNAITILLAITTLIVSII